MPTSTDFEVHGPFKIKPTVMKGGKIIDSASVKHFWHLHETDKTKSGVYVFAIRAGRGIIPWYIGKTTKTFESEIFQYQKLTKYHSTLMSIERGTPVFLFVEYPRVKGKLSSSKIDQLETFLIRAGKMRNKQIRNDKKVAPQWWSIRGVFPRIKLSAKRIPIEHLLARSGRHHIGELRAIELRRPDLEPIDCRVGHHAGVEQKFLAFSRECVATLAFAEIPICRDKNLKRRQPLLPIDHLSDHNVAGWRLLLIEDHGP